MENKIYLIRKTIIGKNLSVIMNDSLGSVLEFNSFDEVSKMCEILNVNSDNNCRYEIHTVNGYTPKDNK